MGTTRTRSAATRPSTDAISLLKRDHQAVKELFAEADALGPRASAARGKLFEKIASALTLHAQIEEEIFYPAFRERTRNASDEREEVLEAYEEHGVVKHLIADLEATDPNDESFAAKLNVLKESVEHHVKEEEGTLFKMVREAFDRDELEELGQRIEAAKASASS